MRKITAALFVVCLLVLVSFNCIAEKVVFELDGQIHESISPINIQITKVFTDETRDRPHSLLVHITYADGHAQEFCYASIETPGI